MIKATATATEMQNNFGRYLSIVLNGGEVLVTKNGKAVGRLIPRDQELTFLTDALTGILPEIPDDKAAMEEALRKKYEAAD